MIIGYEFNKLNFIKTSVDTEKLIIVSNFDANETYDFELKIPEDIIEKWKLKDGVYEMIDELYGTRQRLNVKQGSTKVAMTINPLESFIFTVK